LGDDVGHFEPSCIGELRLLAQKHRFCLYTFLEAMARADMAINVIERPENSGYAWVSRNHPLIVALRDILRERDAEA
jgi:hypothetical protein